MSLPSVQPMCAQDTQDSQTTKGRQCRILPLPHFHPLFLLCTSFFSPSHFFPFLQRPFAVLWRKMLCSAPLVNSVRPPHSHPHFLLCISFFSNIFSLYAKTFHFTLDKDAFSRSSSREFLTGVSVRTEVVLLLVLVVFRGLCFWEWPHQDRQKVIKDQGRCSNSRHSGGNGRWPSDRHSGGVGGRPSSRYV